MDYVQTFDKNTQSRDFVVGDIHGRYDELMANLTSKGFDFENDRLFSVGDLVDRGSQSRDVVELIDENWFYPARGNHDQFIIDQFDGERVLLFQYQDFTPQEIHFKLEGQWFAKLSENQKQWFYDKLKNLPYLIEVETESGKVGICHAGLPRYINNWEHLKSQLFDRNIREQVIRTRRAPKQDRRIQGIDVTIHGHTCFEKIHQVQNSFWIDTFDKTGSHTVIEIEKLFEMQNSDQREESICPED